MQASWIFMVWDQNSMWRQYSVRHMRHCQVDATGANDQFILNLNLIKLVKQEDSLTGGNTELLPDMLTYSFHGICGQLRTCFYVRGSTMTFHDKLYWAMWLCRTSFLLVCFPQMLMINILIWWDCPLSVWNIIKNNSITISISFYHDK